MTVLYLKNFTGKIEAIGSISLTEESLPTKPKIETKLPEAKIPVVDNDFIKDFQQVGIPDCNLEQAPGIYMFTYSVNGNQSYPFYVGESKDLSVRVSKGDHLGTPQVMDPQGFKVKEAIKYLQEKGLTVSILYKYTYSMAGEWNKQRRALERKIQQHLEDSGLVLINKKEGFAIRKGMSKEEKEKLKLVEGEKVHSFCDEYYGKDYINVA